MKQTNESEYVLGTGSKKRVDGRMILLSNSLVAQILSSAVAAEMKYQTTR